MQQYFSLLFRQYLIPKTNTLTQRSIAVHEVESSTENHHHLGEKVEKLSVDVLHVVRVFYQFLPNKLASLYNFHLFITFSAR